MRTDVPALLAIPGAIVWIALFYFFPWTIFLFVGMIIVFFIVGIIVRKGI